MAKFAQEANKAAKSLSTTTTEYTKASLIYYQQGLSDKEVKERADITIKMANASGASAEKVSNQLTAVWNNFNDGTKALEYYADVMTALGAATASSTDEISNGLNKFASVAETVGLSYEYAASALATVTSTTRESADVVGTAFKTLFARIQDLELGKTLDDGTTMGKYSEALAKVGINIKEANGNIKTMDTLLTEMADKWETLNKDSQVALAQNVAGVRQYTQLVALLDNWDFFQSNLETSLNSTGELDKQAKIYAESWEAAKDRVKASLETIYDKILNDEAFIEILNNFAKFIDAIDYMIDRIGGLEGVLASLGAVLTRIFSKQLSQSINDMTYGLKMMTAKGRQAVKDQKLNVMEDFVKGFGANNLQTT
jgi:TP901 family phage tail tape measure protein